MPTHRANVNDVTRVHERVKYVCMLFLHTMAKAHLIVADSGNYRVKVFRSCDGQLLWSVDSDGRGRKRLDFTSGLCCDGRGGMPFRSATTRSFSAVPASGLLSV